MLPSFGPISVSIYGCFDTESIRHMNQFDSILVEIRFDTTSDAVRICNLVNVYD